MATVYITYSQTLSTQVSLDVPDDVENIDQWIEDHREDWVEAADNDLELENSDWWFDGTLKGYRFKYKTLTDGHKQVALYRVMNDRNGSELDEWLAVSPANSIPDHNAEQYLRNRIHECNNRNFLPTIIR